MSAKLNMSTLTCREDDRWRGSHSVTILSNTGYGLAGSGTGTVQLHDYGQVCGPQWIASGQYPWTLEHPISHGRPSESQRADTTC